MKREPGGTALRGLGDVLRPVSRRALTALSRRAMWLLLAALLMLVFVAPVLRVDRMVFQVGTDAVLMVTILAGTVALSPRRRLAIIVGLFGLAAVALLVAQWLLPSSLGIALRDAAMLITVTVMAVAVAIYVFIDRLAPIDRIVGAVALYLLIALAFALGFSLIASYDPSAFTGVHYDVTRIANWFYFSLATLTTAGYGDIVPVAPAARSLAMFEALLGQLYPAIILAKLVSGEMPADPPATAKPRGTVKPDDAAG